MLLLLLKYDSYWQGFSPIFLDKHLNCRCRKVCLTLARPESCDAMDNNLVFLHFSCKTVIAKAVYIDLIAIFKNAVLVLR